MRQLFQDLIRPQRRVCSSHAFLLPLERPTPLASRVHFGHRVPSVLLPINRIIVITSAEEMGPLELPWGQRQERPPSSFA